MKLVGELDAGNRHVQFDERGRETECWPSAPNHRARPRLYHISEVATYLIEVRLMVEYPRWEPNAGKPHVRIWAEGAR